MSFKKLIIRSVIWTIVGIGVGMLGVWYLMEHPIPGTSSDARSKALGESVGVIIGIGYGVIWLPSAFRYGQERRERQHRRGRKSR